MRSRVLSVTLFAAAFSTLAAAKSSAQMIPWSQYGSVTQRLGETEIQIRYRRPVARGRELFGALVTWNEPWAPGADSATTVRFSTDVLVDGHRLPAGTYSIWMIPNPDQWTVILSRAWQVYHTPYPEGEEALRLPVTPAQGQHMETLTFHFPVVDGANAVLAFQWGTTVVEIPIAIEVEADDG
jgi:hypothetical protein